MEFIDFHQQLEATPTYVILGVQGSGTNLISNILERIFQISVVRDRSLILSAAGQLIGNDDRAAAERVRRCVYQSIFPGPIRKRLLSRQWYHQAKNYRGIEEYFDEVEVVTPSSLAHFFYSYHAYATGGRLKGIKSDDCWQHLDKLPHVLPNRKYIMIARDPRDNLLSIMNKDFGPRTIYTAARFVKHQLRLYLDELAVAQNDGLLTKYETLLHEPEQFVEAFASFSGVDAPSNYPELLVDLKIRRENSSKWTKWTDYEIAVAESVLGDEMNRLGYELHSSAPKDLSGLEVVNFRMRDVLLRIPQRLKHIWDHKILAK